MIGDRTTPELEALAKQIVDSAYKVHRALGPGLLESVYEKCLFHALTIRGIKARRQVELPITFEGLKLESGLCIDLLVEDKIIVEIKAVEKLMPIHDAQLLTYLKLSGLQLGLLINFNVPLIRDGIKRIIL